MIVSLSYCSYCDDFNNNRSLQKKGHLNLRVLKNKQVREAVLDIPVLSSVVSCLPFLHAAVFIPGSEGSLQEVTFPSPKRRNNQKGQNANTELFFFFLLVFSVASLSTLQNSTPLAGSPFSLSSFFFARPVSIPPPFSLPLCFISSPLTV